MRTIISAYGLPVEHKGPNGMTFSNAITISSSMRTRAEFRDFILQCVRRGGHLATEPRPSGQAIRKRTGHRCLARALPGRRGRAQRAPLMHVPFPQAWPAGRGSPIA
jgi:hypothetical protein